MKSVITYEPIRVPARDGGSAGHLYGGDFNRGLLQESFPAGRMRKQLFHFAAQRLICAAGLQQPRFAQRRLAFQRRVKQFLYALAAFTIHPISPFPDAGPTIPARRESFPVEMPRCGPRRRPTSSFRWLGSPGAGTTEAATSSREK